MDPLYSVEQVRLIEKAALSGETPPLDLMVHAGTAAFKTLQKTWPQAGRITIFAGHGNNGGDGYIVAKLAQHAGLDVNVYSIGNPQELQEPAAWAWHNCVHSGVEVKPFMPNQDYDADVFVDALLGIGLSGTVREPYASAIEVLNRSGKPILSLDVPSGLNADTGTYEGKVVHATVTETFIGLKPGLFTAEGAEVAGKVYHDSLGIHQELMTELTPHSFKASVPDLSSLGARRSKSSHKGDFGHVLVIGGDCGMSGAVRMAGEAAARTGAGLVSIATRPDHADLISATRPELMCHGVKRAKDLRPLLEKATVIVIGPGLGRSSWGESLWEAVQNSSQPMIVDADALYHLAKKPNQQLQWVLTPHPGEAAQLLGSDAKSIQEDRFAAVKQLQRQYGGVTVLKGAGTLVNDGVQPISVCALGNPGMASGGMGDVLSGILGGLIAQGLSSSEAAHAGVLIHSAAGDRAAQTEGERGLLAMDLIHQLRAVMNNCPAPSSSLEREDVVD